MSRTLRLELLLAICLGVVLACAERKEAKSMAGTDTGTARRPIPPIDAVAPKAVETATFALGCFWGPDSRFGSLKGVVRTRVGYAGGTKLNPTYHDLGDHTECVQIDFDPSQITYEALLNVFWSAHDPLEPPSSRQYMSAIFCHNAEQERVALASRERLEAACGHRLHTAVAPLDRFYIAEDYHQKYLLGRDRALSRELAAIYPRKADFVNSTAVARVNGYVGGHGSPAQLAEELASLGLSPEGQQRLRELARRAKPVSCH